MNEGQQISSKFVGTLLILLVFLVLPALINIPRGYANLTPYSITSSVLYNNPGSGVESSISVDPNNSSYLIDSFVGQPLAGTVPYSLDGGATWHNSTQATGWCSIPGSNSCAVGNDPWIAVGPNGTDYAILYFSNATQQEVYMITSTTHGVTWAVDNNYFASDSNRSDTTWTFLNGTTTTGCYPAFFQAVVDYPKIAVDSGSTSPFKGYIYIVGDFPLLQNGSCTIENGFVRSTDGGRTWDTHLIPNPFAPSGVAETEQLAVAPSGEIYFARLDSQSGNILFEKSTNGGTTWSYSELAQSKLIPTSVNLAVSPSGTLYIVYGKCLSSTCQGATPGTSAFYLITSADDGTTWSSPLQITDTNAVPYSVDPCEPVPTNCYFTSHSPPTIAVTSQGVALVWRDWRNSSNNTNADIYAYIPSIGSSNIRLTTLTGAICVRGGYIECSYGGNDFLTVTSSVRGIYVAYGMDVNGDGNPDVVVTKVAFPYSMTLNPLTIYQPFHNGTPRTETNTTTLTLQAASWFSGTITVTITPFNSTPKNGPVTKFTKTGTSTESFTLPLGGSNSDTITILSCNRTPARTTTFTVTATLTGYQNGLVTFTDTVTGTGHFSC